MEYTSALIPRILRDIDVFKIVFPESSNDLINEGVRLRHCVSSYVDAVSEGRTNIIFIRKKDDIDEPYFTVEVSNDNAIVQIRGFGNCLPEDDNLIDFIEKWKAKSGLAVVDKKYFF